METGHRVSLYEVRQRYAAEWLELNTELTLTVNITVTPGFDADGNRVGERVVACLYVEGERDSAACGDMKCRREWDLDTVAGAFHIDPGARVWEVVDPQA